MCKQRYCEDCCDKTLTLIAHSEYTYVCDCADPSNYKTCLFYDHYYCKLCEKKSCKVCEEDGDANTCPVCDEAKYVYNNDAFCEIHYDTYVADHSA